MKQRVIRSLPWVFVLAAVLFLGLSFTSLGKVGPDQDLHSGRTVYIDLGKKAHGTPITATVAFRNVDTKPVHISSVQTSCGCTTVAGYQADVQPGNSTTLQVSINTAGRSGQSQFMISVRFREAAPADAVLVADFGALH